MKLLILLLICASASSSKNSNTENFSYSATGERVVQKIYMNPIDKLWRLVLEFIRALLRKYEPLKVPDMPVQTVTGDGISLKAKFNNVEVSKAENFVIDSIDNNILGLWAKFQVTLPTMYLEGDYSVTGTVKGKRVNGKGHFTLDIEKLVTGGFMKVYIKETYLQMSEFDMYYTIKNLTFSETGLVVEGMTHEQLEDLFQHSFLTYFQNNEKYVCSQVSAYVIEQANKIMYGKSLQALLDWLKEFIDGKIISTPRSIDQ